MKVLRVNEDKSLNVVLFGHRFRYRPDVETVDTLLDAIINDEDNKLYESSLEDVSTHSELLFETLVNIDDNLKNNLV